MYCIIHIRIVDPYNTHIFMHLHSCNRLGPRSHDGVARFCGHVGMEHLFPPSGHHHPQAQDVTTQPSGQPGRRASMLACLVRTGWGL